MPIAAPQIPLSVPPILPRTRRSWAEPLAPAVHRFFIPTDVIGGFENARRSGAGGRFARRLLESLNIRFRVDDGDLERIPAREFGGMRGRTVRARIGLPIRPGMLAAYRDAEQATAYLRLRTFFYRIDPNPRPRLSRHSPRRGSGRAHRREQCGSFLGK